jgi:hypothetical protein
MAQAKARGQGGTSLALVRESPLANSVTSCPKSTNSSVNQETTRSVPPYNFGGTLSARGAICAMRIVLFPTSIELGFRRLNTIRQGSFGSLLGRQSSYKSLDRRCQKPDLRALAFSFCRVPYASWNSLADGLALMRERRSAAIVQPSRRGGPLEPRPSIRPESSDNYKMLAPTLEALQRQGIIRDKITDYQS